MNLVFPENTKIGLIELWRDQIYLSQDFKFLSISKENNSTLNSTDTILKWNFTNDESLEGHLNIRFIASGKEIDQNFQFCRMYSLNTISHFGQELFINLFANFQKSWYRILLDLFTSSHCPLLKTDDFINPAYIKMEQIISERMECNKRIRVKLNIFRRGDNINNKEMIIPLIAIAKYNGTIKCADEKQSSSFLFYRRNAYLADAYIE
ncbi:uncharacterized protein LOC122502916 isoform X2 [Leptopilina heterotoma]|nr:uncharacterized protein LOC122502916 isoform X2 [Leptopilina heterotoma]